VTKERIAILGGGVGGVTAAMALSEPGWEDHFSSITLYQLGWRLGGKGASGRGADRRIEEHGLHIWFGFYENAFRLLDHCHKELDRLEAEEGKPRWKTEFTSVSESFLACDHITLTDYDGCSWKPWSADFFEAGDDRPWLWPDPRKDGERPDDWSAVFYLGRCLRLAANLVESLYEPGDALAIVPGTFVDDPQTAITTADDVGGSLNTSVKSLVGALTGDVHAALDAAAETLDAVIAEGADFPLALDVIDTVLRVIDVALEFIRGRADELIRHSDAARRAWYVVDLMLAIARGLIEDGVLAHDDLDVLNEDEFRDWLLKHGAARESVDCALVRAIVYDLAFAYSGGDPRRPAAEAGTALRGLLRAFFTYRGALMWKMSSGMGDTIFAPIYELLHKRGVDVRFFHRVEQLRVDDQGRVSEIDIDLQAEAKKGTSAEHYVDVPAPETAKAKKGAPTLAEQSTALWPNRPLVHLAGQAASPIAAEDYESWLADPAITRVSSMTLTRDPGPDGFDLVVFALPIGCVPCVAAPLMQASQRWQRAVKHIETVATQAMQLWLDVPGSTLTKPSPDEEGLIDGVVVGGYVEPHDTWADMPHLVAREDVPEAATVAYFCNVFADGPQPPRGAADEWRAAQLARARAEAVRFLRRDVRYIWPGAVDAHGHFKWKHLVDANNSVGEQRLDSQYIRVNYEPSERYVLSVPGSSKHRIHPGDSGFENLFVAGDWTQCGINAGCVEAATMSGLLAANAIHERIGADARIQHIIGYHGP
jgi:uncharacterized protein with NAD-binding domain and iron-sulfur cluster